MDGLDVEEAMRVPDRESRVDVFRVGLWLQKNNEGWGSISMLRFFARKQAKLFSSENYSRLDGEYGSSMVPSDVKSN